MATQERLMLFWAHANSVTFRRAKYDIENLISKLKGLLYGEEEVLDTLVNALYLAQR